MGRLLRRSSIPSLSPAPREKAIRIFYSDANTSSNLLSPVHVQINATAFVWTFPVNAIGRQKHRTPEQKKRDDEAKGWIGGALLCWLGALLYAGPQAGLSGEALWIAAGIAGVVGGALWQLVAGAMIVAPIVVAVHLFW